MIAAWARGVGQRRCPCCDAVRPNCSRRVTSRRQPQADKQRGWLYAAGCPRPPVRRLSARKQLAATGGRSERLSQRCHLVIPPRAIWRGTAKHAAAGAVCRRQAAAESLLPLAVCTHPVAISRLLGRWFFERVLVRLPKAAHASCVVLQPGARRGVEVLRHRAGAFPAGHAEGRGMPCCWAWPVRTSVLVERTTVHPASLTGAPGRGHRRASRSSRS